MRALKSLRDRLRTLLGDQSPRKLPRRSAKPRIGSHVVHVEKGVRFTVQAGLSDELWIWLMDSGWRVVTHRPDRRQYRDLPSSWVTRLIDAHPTTRNKLIASAIEQAEVRAAIISRPPES
jgi:hypothetical protein